ncbi:MAG: prepilin peptidase [Bacillus sp. (in: Bacteria)]|nr:prepilin peptidase [Bacillus sp. (in: firmicutes)]
MDLLLHIYLFVLGAVLGSFYNVVGLRVTAGKSIVSPRSHCPNCQTTLSWKELIPVVSFFMQQGKCRNCSLKISPVYPFFELLTASLFTISPLLVGWSKELLVALALISLLHIITVSDITTMLIPDKILLVFLPIFIITRIISPLTPWWDSVLGAAAGFTILLIIALVSKGGMGGGDIKLFGVLGIILGLTGTLLTLFIASFIGAIFGIIGILLKKLQRGKPMAFGPFIAISALISYYFHEQLLSWYFSLLIW